MSGTATFGPGVAILTRTDVTPATPVNAGFCQSLNISLKGSTKELYGQNQFPLVAARSTIKATGKLVSALDSGIAFNNTFIGQTLQTGGLTLNINEPHTSATSTVTVANSANFDADLGVSYANTGLPLTRVASAPTVGQYAVAAGIYTVATGDENTPLLMTYTSTVTTGESIIVANKPIGFTPTFQLDYFTTLNQPATKTVGWRFFACIADSFSIDYKLEDFGLPNFEFSMFANAAGNVFEKIYSEAD